MIAGTETMPPQAVDTEMSVLAAMMVDNRCIGDAVEILGTDGRWFYTEAHRHIYEAILAVYDANSPVDSITLTAQLQQQGTLDACGGVGYLADIKSREVSGHRITHHAEIVLKAAHSRELIEVFADGVRMAHDAGSEPMAVMDTVEGRLLGMAGSDRNECAAIDSVMEDALAEIEKACGNPGNTGITTGLTDLTAITGGWQPGDLIILAARPSVGKSALALGCATAAASAGLSVAIHTLEMTNQQYGQRMIATAAGVDLHKMRSGKLSQDEFSRVAHQAGELSRLKSHMHINDSSGISPIELRAKCRRLKQRFGLDLVVVDYLQLMRFHEKQQSREQEVSKISQSLKNLAKELQVPVLALSQLSRAGAQRTNSRPVLSDLRDSGALEQDADVVVFLHPEVDAGERTGKMELILAKQRSGPVGSVYVQFDATSTAFRDIAPEYRTNDHMEPN